MSKLSGHLRTINRHKWYVMKLCFRAGMYSQGILHDLSKYSPVELVPSVKYYQGGKRSPLAAEKEEKGFSEGWLHHKGRNRHHFEYWIDYCIPPNMHLVGHKMPKRYVAEMVIDRIAASKNYKGKDYSDVEPLIYWNNGLKHYTIHEDAVFLTTFLLEMLRDEGEKNTLKYIKKTLMKNKNGDYHIIDGKIVYD